jgi:hypothetical protein
MPIPTPNMALQQPVGGDNASTALKTYVANAFSTIDVHNHGGGALGVVLPAGSVPLSAGQATGAALGADVVTITGAQNLTNKTLTTPAISGDLTVSGKITSNGDGLVLHSGVGDAVLASGTALSLMGGTQTVTYGPAFASGFPVVVATLSLSGSLHAYVVQIESQLASGFTFSVLDESSARVGPIQINWIAIGTR